MGSAAQTAKRFGDLAVAAAALQSDLRAARDRAAITEQADYDVLMAAFMAAGSCLSACRSLEKKARAAARVAP